MISKGIINEIVEELDSFRRNNIDKEWSENPEYILLEEQKEIAGSEFLSAGIESREDLEQLANYIEQQDPRPLEGRSSFEISFSRFINHRISDLMQNYGENTNESNKPLSVTSQHNYPNSEEYTTKFLPGLESKEDLIGRIATVYITHQKRVDIKEAKIKEKGMGVSYPSLMLADRILDGFDDWKAALVFESYSHRWTREYAFEPATYRPLGRLNVKRVNKDRYARFSLTSEHAVKSAKPGALYDVERVFGVHAGQFVDGDLTKFKELLSFSKIKDAKQIMQQITHQDPMKAMQMRYEKAIAINN